MRKNALVVTLLTVGVSLPAFATVNHGTFNGTDVDFVDVSETTTTAGDPAELWGPPALSGTGDRLAFFPAAFTSQCSTGGSDVTTSELETTIEAQGLATIDTLMLTEKGDVVLTTFPPYGNPGTNASASMAGSVTVLEDTTGPIAPVVIPFVGTFTPSSSFALPTDFDTSLWTGSIMVDVASQVPNAKVVKVFLENALESNCAPGNSSAKIQKKVVSGPAVAISVNPIECNLELDKTCCITQPALPELGSCEGDMVSMTLEFTGDKCRNSSNDQGGAFRCHGRRSIGDPADLTVLWNTSEVTATPSSSLLHGDEVTFTSSTGTLFDKTKFKVTDDWWRKQYLKIDTSCERAFQCGDQFGAFKVTGFESTLGGLVDCNAPPPPPTCAVPGAGDPVGTPCDAKVIDMVLEYNGQACQDPLGNPQGGNAVCSGDATGAVNVGIEYVGKQGYKEQISPASMINDGDRIRVTSTAKSGMHPNQEYLITDANGVVQSIDFHTSCSQPLNLGDEFGSLKLVEFTTKNGTTVALATGGSGDGTADACEVPLAPPGPHCSGPLEDITLVYIGDFLGEGCTVSNSQGGWGQCSGVADPGDPDPGDADPGGPVSVTPTSGYVTDPVDQIEFGDLVTISRDDSNALGIFGLDTTGAGGTQHVQIKASCWRPLSLGDRFGSWVVFGMERQEDGPISLGGNIQYQYTVTNPSGTDTVDNVTIGDDQLGDVVGGTSEQPTVSLAPGESQIFIKPATLFGTTTNVATASGDVAGSFCLPGVDQVTVDVLAPPQGAFTCDEPITELSMTWNGAQTVNVRAWAGLPVVSQHLGDYNGVAPGETITVSDMGASYPTWEIFAQGGSKLGESSFDLWCNDKNMNGVNDCGKENGNLKWNDGNLINDWLLEGMVAQTDTLSCTPGTVASPPDCGFGPELLVVLPGLMWVHRRRMRRA